MIDKHIIRGMAIGSRRFGNVKANSDWDYEFEDTPATRDFLESMGVKIEAFKQAEGTIICGKYTSREYHVEIFMVEDIEQSSAVWTVLGVIRFMAMWGHKQRRRAILDALGRCVKTLWAIRAEHEAEKKVEVKRKFRLRPKPF